MPYSDYDHAFMSCTCLIWTRGNKKPRKQQGRTSPCSELNKYRTFGQNGLARVKDLAKSYALGHERGLMESLQKDPHRWIYPEIIPYRTGRLKVSVLHELYFEESGNLDRRT